VYKNCFAGIKLRQKQGFEGKASAKILFFFDSAYYLRFDMFLGCREYAVMSIVPYFFVDAICGQAPSPVLLLSEPKFAVF